MNTGKAPRFKKVRGLSGSLAIEKRSPLFFFLLFRYTKQDEKTRNEVLYETGNQIL